MLILYYVIALKAKVKLYFLNCFVISQNEKKLVFLKGREGPILKDIKLRIPFLTLYLLKFYQYLNGISLSI